MIAHTALTEREVARRCVRLPDAHVLKGCDFGVMKQLVSRLLSGQARAESYSGQARIAS